MVGPWAVRVLYSLLISHTPIGPGLCGFPGTLLVKLSEKSRRCLQRSLTGHRNGAFRPSLASVYRPNPRSERCSYPFRTVSLGNPVNRGNLFPKVGASFSTKFRCQELTARARGCKINSNNYI